MRAHIEAQSVLVLLGNSHFRIELLLSVSESCQNHVFGQNTNLTKNGHFATPGEPLRSPKNTNQIDSAYQSGYFKRVFNVASNIPRH